MEVKSITLHTGFTSKTLENIVLGQWPKHFIIGLLENEAFHGEKKKNPLNYFQSRLLILVRNGQLIPSKSHQIIQIITRMRTILYSVARASISLTRKTVWCEIIMSRVNAHMHLIWYLICLEIAACTGVGSNRITSCWKRRLMEDWQNQTAVYFRLNATAFLKMTLIVELLWILICWWIIMKFLSVDLLPMTR